MKTLANNSGFNILSMMFTLVLLAMVLTGFTRMAKLGSVSQSRVTASANFNAIRSSVLNALSDQDICSCNFGEQTIQFSQTDSEQVTVSVPSINLYSRVNGCEKRGSIVSQGKQMGSLEIESVSLGNFVQVSSSRYYATASIVGTGSSSPYPISQQVQVAFNTSTQNGTVSLGECSAGTLRSPQGFAGSYQCKSVEHIIPANESGSAYPNPTIVRCSDKNAMIFSALEVRNRSNNDGDGKRSKACPGDLFLSGEALCREGSESYASCYRAGTCKGDRNPNYKVTLLCCS